MDSKTIHKTAASGTGWLYGGQERECPAGAAGFLPEKGRDGEVGQSCIDHREADCQALV